MYRVAYQSSLVTSSVFQVLGLALTTWRIYIRIKIRRFWWEDAFAAALLFTGLLWIIAEWIYLQTGMHPSSHMTITDS